MTPSEWQPIKTCPESGFFLVCQDGAVRTMWRYKGEWRIPAMAVIVGPWGDSIVGDGAALILPSGYKLAVHDDCAEPTHWMLLPEVPTETEDNQ